METNKHNHKGTKLLKVFIFSLMMLMPFLIFIPNAFYYGFNENAVAQTRIEQDPVYYQSNEVNSVDDIHIGNVYFYNDNFSWLNQTGATINILQFYLLDNSINNNIDITRSLTMYVSNNDSAIWCSYKKLDTGTTGYMAIGNVSFNLKVNGVYDYSYLIVSHLFKTQVIETILETEYSMSITDSMSIAWQEIWSNNLMSWTNNSILKTPINNFVSVFAINNDACISQYLIYLMTLTGLYVVIDIVLEMFIAMTHIFSKEPK